MAFSKDFLNVYYIPPPPILLLPSLEEQLHWAALGPSQVREAEAIGRRGLAAMLTRGLGLLPSSARGERLMLQPATGHVKVRAEAQQQSS